MLRKYVGNILRTMDEPSGAAESTSPTAEGLEDKASSLGACTGWLGHQSTAEHVHRLGGARGAGLEWACPATPGPPL